MTNAVAKTITLLDKSAGQLSKVMGEANKVMASLEGMVATSTELSSEIEFKTSELNLIEENINVESRKAQIELKLRVDEHEEGVLASLLNARKVVTIAPEKLEALEAELSNVKALAEEDKNKAVAVVKASMEAAKQSALQVKGLEHTALVANNEAELKSLKSQIAFLNLSLEKAEASLKAEREARVAIAASESQKQGVVVSTTSK